jgi:hypothetical protein
MIPFWFNSSDVADSMGDDVIYALIEADLVPLFDQPTPALEVTQLQLLLIGHHKLSKSHFASSTTCK